LEKLTSVGWMEMHRSRRIKQEDIAKMLGLSVSQVSRALSDKGEVAPETRKQIRGLAKQLGYTPNIIARSLRSRTTMTLGIIQPNISNPFFSMLVRGIEDVAQKKNYSILVSNTYESMQTEEKLIKSMFDRGVDGLLMVPVRAKHLNTELLLKNSVPVVILGRCTRDSGLHCVVVNDYQAGYMATEHLISRGHKRILYCSGPADMICSIDRLNGFRKALEDHGIPFSEDMVHTGGTSIHDGYESMKECLKQKPDFTAVFAFNDLVAYGCLHALKEHGYNAPRDYAIMGFDDSDLNVVLSPQLTSIHQPTHEMGKKAAELILNLIDSEESVEPRTIVFEPELRVRETT